MPRLTKADWKHIRARYEVDGELPSALAKEFSIHVSALTRRMKAEGWEQGKYRPMSTEKANAIATIAKIDEIKSTLPIETQKAIDFLARKELELQGVSVEFRRSLLAKGRALIDACTDPGDLLTLAKAHSETVRPSTTQPAAVTQIAIDAKGNGGAKGAPAMIHNIMPVPVADSVDEWEAVAVKQQEAIKAGR